MLHMDARDEILSLNRWLHYHWPQLPIYVERPRGDSPRPSLHLATVAHVSGEMTAVMYADKYTHQIDYRGDDGVLGAQKTLDEIERRLQQLRSIPAYLHDFTYYRPTLLKITGTLPPGDHFFRVSAINSLGEETVACEPIGVVLDSPGGVRVYPTRYPSGNPLAAYYGIYYCDTAHGTYRLITELPETRLRTRVALELTGVPDAGRAPLESGRADTPNSAVFYRTIRIESVEKRVNDDDIYPQLPLGRLRVRTCSLSIRPPYESQTTHYGGEPSGSGVTPGDTGTPPITTIDMLLLDP